MLDRFAVATVFNMGLLSFNKQSDATLEAITVMAEAGRETSTSGYTYDCNPSGNVCIGRTPYGWPLFIQG